MKDDLLLFLTENCGCMYLSDLSNKQTKPFLKKYISQTDMTQFPLEEWYYAFEYLFKKSCQGTTYKEVQREFLVALSR